MIEINKAQFQELFSKKEINVFCFYKPDCVVCEQHYEKLSKYPISTAFHKVDIGEDLIYYKTELGMWVIPETRIYYDSKIVWACGGILYDKQLNLLIDTLRKQTNG